ncbi:MAG: carbohydrate porin, partial [Planctomycetota bacterium]
MATRIQIFCIFGIISGVLEPCTGLLANAADCDSPSFEAVCDDPVNPLSACDGLACDDFCCQSRQTGDCAWIDQWFGCKQKIAASGISFNGNLTQFYFGNVDGGIRRTDRFGGHGDYLSRIDFGKLGVQEGLILQLRAEHRYGQSVVNDTGVFLPQTLATELPVNDQRDLFLTNVLFQQFLSESFAIYFGKLDSLDGDQNAYASGRGITQFSNTALVANPIALRTVPYASLGCGFLFLQDGEPLFNFLVINPTDTADSDGFDELFSEGVALSAELRFKTTFSGKPGHQLFGATWSSRDFVALDQDPRIVLPNVPIN